VLINLSAVSHIAVACTRWSWSSAFGTVIRYGQKVPEFEPRHE